MLLLAETCCRALRSRTLLLSSECLYRWAQRQFCCRRGVFASKFVALLGGVSCSTLFRATVVKCKATTSPADLRPTLLARNRHLEAETVGGADDTSLSLGELWRLIRPYWYLLAAAVAFAVGAALVNIRLPLLLGELVNAVSLLITTDAGERSSSNVASLAPIAVRIVAHYAAQALLTAAYITVLSTLGERIATQLRTELFHSLLSQDMTFFDTVRTGDMASRLGVDVHEFKSAFKLTISQGLRTTTQVGGSAMALYFISPEMTTITLCVLPVVVGTGWIMGASLRALSRRAQAQQAVAGAVADEAFANIRTVRSFAMEDAECRLYAQECQRSQSMQESLGMGIGIFQGLANFALNGIVLGVLYGGAMLISEQRMSAGDLMSFLITSQTIQRSMAQLSLLTGQVVKGWTAGARVMQFIHLVPSIPLSGGRSIPHHSLLGEIRLENVHFKYPSRPGHTVFDGINLHIPAGKLVALCGKSGAGKSTIAALLERMYEVDAGRITLDGQDIRELDPKWLRGSVLGVISQEPVLFATTIRENIRYGKPDATDQEVEEAARLANAALFVDGFPSGYDTVVGERGVALSGGQKQRIAIARALLKQPPVLILDEATSALDAESERLVHEALERVTRDRTVLVIAHRLSTIQNADLIAVIGDGGVLEVGTHKQLLKKKRHYWTLISSQINGEIL